MRKTYSLIKKKISYFYNYKEYRIKSKQMNKLQRKNTRLVHKMIQDNINILVGKYNHLCSEYNKKECGRHKWKHKQKNKKMIYL